MKQSILTKYRRVMALALALLLVVGLTGCFAKEDPTPSEEPSTATVPSDPTEPSEKPTDEPTTATDPSEKPTEPEKDAVMGTVSANNLNVRSNHSTDSSVLSQLPVNLRIEIMEQKTEGGTNWGRIGEMTLPNGTKIAGGWINLHYVKLDTEDEATQPTTGTNTDSVTNVNDDEEKEGSITATQLYIRKGAGSTYDTNGSYKKGDRVTILETKTVSGTTWGRTDKGWISMTYVKLDGSAGSAVDTGTNVAGPGANLGGTTGTGSSSSSDKDSDIESNGKTTALGWIVIDTGSLNLRKGPGTKYDTNGTVSNGDRYQYFQTSGNWLRIEKGWINKSYVYVEGTTADDATTGTVKADEMNVRQGPGPGYKSLGTIKKGDSLVILGQANGWGYTEMGWVKMEYIDIGDGKIVYKTGKGIVITDGLNVRAEANAKSDTKILTSLDEDDKVNILEIGGDNKDWGKIEYATGKYGWINLRYVKMEGDGSSSGSSSSTTKYDVTVGTLTNGTGCEIKPSTTYCAKGTEVTLYVKTASGLKLKSLFITDANGNKTNVTTSKKFTMPASNVTVTAEFINESDIEYKVTIGTITGSGKVSIVGDVNTFTTGTTVTLNATPDTGYELDKIYCNGTAISGNTFSMPAGDATITATFKQIKYTVTVNCGDHGTAEADKTTAADGETVKLTIKPADDYEIDKIELVADYDTSGISITDNAFKMPPFPLTVKVTFKAKTT